jgi:hypothetical protein
MASSQRRLAGSNTVIGKLSIPKTGCRVGFSPSGSGDRAKPEATNLAPEKQAYIEQQIQKAVEDYADKLARERQAPAAGILYQARPKISVLLIYFGGREANRSW